MNKCLNFFSVLLLLLSIFSCKSTDYERTVKSTVNGKRIDLANYEVKVEVLSSEELNEKELYEIFLYNCAKYTNTLSYNYFSIIEKEFSKEGLTDIINAKLYICYADSTEESLSKEQVENMNNIETELEDGAVFLNSDFYFDKYKDYF